MVTKIRHRKRPDLVPVFVKGAAGFYGVSSRRPFWLRPLLQADLLRDRLEALAGSIRTPHRRQLSALRVLDVMIRQHTRGCEAG